MSSDDDFRPSRPSASKKMFKHDPEDDSAAGGGGVVSKELKRVRTATETKLLHSSHDAARPRKKSLRIGKDSAAAQPPAVARPPQPPGKVNAPGGSLCEKAMAVPGDNVSSETIPPLKGGSAADSGDFKENLSKQLPSITTRHLQSGQQKFVCKVINSSGGVKRLMEGMQGRTLLSWRIAYKIIGADDESADNDVLADDVLADDCDVGDDCDVSENDEQVVGMSVAFSTETCWFVSAAAFGSHVEFWGICHKILTSGNALKVLKHLEELAGDTCLFWDVALAVCALQDEAPRTEAKRGPHKRKTSANGAGGRVRGANKKNGNGKNTTSRGKTTPIQSLHKSSLLYAPHVLGRQEHDVAGDEERRCCILTIQTSALHIASLPKSEDPTVRPPHRLDMPMLLQLVRAARGGVCLDLARLADISGVLRQRKERLEEDLEVQHTLRRAVWAHQAAALGSQMGGGHALGGRGEAMAMAVAVAPQEDAAIADIEKELLLLLRLRRTSNSIWRAARRADGERAGQERAGQKTDAQDRRRPSPRVRANLEGPQKIAPQMRLLADACERHVIHACERHVIHAHIGTLHVAPQLLSFESSRAAAEPCAHAAKDESTTASSSSSPHARPSAATDAVTAACGVTQRATIDEHAAGIRTEGLVLAPAQKQQHPVQQQPVQQQPKQIGGMLHLRERETEHAREQVGSMLDLQMHHTPSRTETDAPQQHAETNSLQMQLGSNAVRQNQMHDAVGHAVAYAETSWDAVGHAVAYDAVGHAVAYASEAENAQNAVVEAELDKAHNLQSAPPDSPPLPPPACPPPQYPLSYSPRHAPWPPSPPLNSPPLPPRCPAPHLPFSHVAPAISSNPFLPFDLDALPPPPSAATASMDALLDDLPPPLPPPPSAATAATASILGHPLSASTACPRPPPLSTSTASPNPSVDDVSKMLQLVPAHSSCSPQPVKPVKGLANVEREGDKLGGIDEKAGIETNKQTCQVEVPAQKQDTMSSEVKKEEHSDARNRQRGGGLETESEEEFMDDDFLAALNLLEEAAAGRYTGGGTGKQGADKRRQEIAGNQLHDSKNGKDGKCRSDGGGGGGRVWRVHPTPEIWRQGMLGAVGYSKPAVHSLPPPTLIPLDYEAAHESLHNRWMGGTRRSVLKGTLLAVAHQHSREWGAENGTLNDNMFTWQRAVVVRDAAPVGPPPWKVPVKMISDHNSSEASLCANLSVLDSMDRSMDESHDMHMSAPPERERSLNQTDLRNILDEVLTQAEEREREGRDGGTATAATAPGRDAARATATPAATRRSEHKLIDAKDLHLLQVESLQVDFRDVLVAEQGCYLVHCTIPHLHVWALALLAQDPDLISALAGRSRGDLPPHATLHVPEKSTRVGKDVVKAGGDNATNNSKHAVNGVWERVGLIWAERANIGFSTSSAPAKARRMCQGISLGKGLETLSNDLEISLGEAESWIAAFSAAFPALGRKLSALRRRGDGRASGRASGTDARTASATDARTDARTLAGRLLVDSSLASGGWERVRKVVDATSQDLKKGLFLCVCQVLAKCSGPKEQAKKALCEGLVDWSYGGRAPWASRVLIMTDQGVLLQVSSEFVEGVMVEVQEAFAAFEWSPGGGDSFASGPSELGARQQIVCNPNVDFVYGKNWKTSQSDASAVD